MRVPIATIALVLLVSSFTPAQPNRVPVIDDAAIASKHWEHLRLDDIELDKLGNGSVERGLSALGNRGFRLFAVTTQDETGQARWLILKRQPWNQPMPRPKFEYRRMDDVLIQGLANGDFAGGMKRIEADGWELVAFTNGRRGAIGNYYFERPVGGR